MTDSHPRETREVKAGGELQRSLEGVVDAVMSVASNPVAYAVPGAYVAGKVVDAVKDVFVSKTTAQASIEVARIEHGYPQDGGAHRADA